MITSRCGVRLRSRDSSSRNGTAKWKTIRNSARYCQPLLMRVIMYGNLFDQIRGEGQHVLREVEVRPEHHERERQLAEVVEVLGLSRCDIGSRRARKSRSRS